MVYIAARLIGGRQSTINRIVIHGTSSACKRGGARGNAAWFQNAKARGSAHYVVDPGEIVQCVGEDRVAAHAPPNTGSIGIELCDPNAGDPNRWYDPVLRHALDDLAGIDHEVGGPSGLRVLEPRGVAPCPAAFARGGGAVDHDAVDRGLSAPDEPGPDVVHQCAS